VTGPDPSENRATDPAAPLPCRGSFHLDLLVGEIDRLVMLLHEVLAHTTPEEIAARRHLEDAATAEATLRLDGALRATTDGGGERAGTWLDALGDDASRFGGADGDPASDRTDDDPLGTAELGRLAALERAGVDAGVAADDLADAFGNASSDAAGLGMALATLHGRMTAGLVAPDRVGRLRRGPRVVHDASVGRVLYFPTDPSLLADAWDASLRHVTGSGAGASAARLPAAVRAAILHLELVRHQPFDAANGRVARAAGRLALLSDGLLPSGLGVPDTALAEDTLAYHEEIAASVRRRDATAWAERVLEAHGLALRLAIEALRRIEAPSHAASGMPGHPPIPADLGDTFTLGDVASLLGTSTSDARGHCSVWVVDGAARRVPGSAGLRLRRPGPQPTTA
jgi:hypothetical protein